MGQYKTGTVVVINGSNVVTGTDTLWTANVSAGDRFKVKAINTSYRIEFVHSNTRITLDVVWEGDSLVQQDYQINVDRTTNYNFYKIIDEDADWMYWWTLALRNIDTQLKDYSDRIETRATTTTSTTSSSTSSSTSTTTTTSTTSTSSSTSTTTSTTTTTTTTGP